MKTFKLSFQKLKTASVDKDDAKHDDEVLTGSGYDAISDVRGDPMASNQIILVGVGLLLGVILLVVVACVVLLAWKQRKSNKQNGLILIVFYFIFSMCACRCFS